MRTPFIAEERIPWDPRSVNPRSNSPLLFIINIDSEQILLHWGRRNWGSCRSKILKKIKNKMNGSELEGGSDEWLLILIKYDQPY